jgi:GT2 family glycosyltransferase
VLEARQEALSGSAPVELPYLCGAALAVRRADFERVGGFDERLAPYYWEDVDLSLRLRAAVGATVAVAATVEHRHGATIAREPERRRRVVYERNRFLVSWRHLRGARWLAHLGWLPLRLAASVVRDGAVAAGLGSALWRVLSGEGRGAARR